MMIRPSISPTTSKAAPASMLTMPPIIPEESANRGRRGWSYSGYSSCGLRFGFRRLEPVQDLFRELDS